MITELIDKRDTFEIVRDQVGAILALEVANQMQLADAAQKDPEAWKLRIFSERSNPWEEYRDGGPQQDNSPLVNVHFDSSNFDSKASNAVSRQRADATYNIDIYAYAESQNVPGGGHIPGDKAAAIEVHRAVRLVRNILMAGEYTYLGLRGVVGSRWPQTVTVYQPTDGEQRPVQQVHAARITLAVTFNEFAPQVQGEALELLSVQVTRSETGEILVQFDEEYTT